MGEGGSEAAQHTVKNEREGMMTERGTVLLFQSAAIDNTPTPNQKEKIHISQK